MTGKTLPEHGLQKRRESRQENWVLDTQHRPPMLIDTAMNRFPRHRCEPAWVARRHDLRGRRGSPVETV
jgi:hypothetical protein